MLNIYIGRENLDKDRFMFDRIKERLDLGKHVILIVPDQFTLQAEENAFKYLNVDGLMDLEVLSFSRLANRVLREAGGGNKIFVNNYGKYMMISRILLKENENLKVFRDLEGSADFVEKINNFISEVKNHNISPKKFVDILEAEDSDTLLFRKLEDIGRIYESYERKTGDEQIDTSDYLSLFISKIYKSALVNSSEFWLSGFDYLSPKNMDAILEIAKTSGNVNALITAEEGNRFFGLTNSLSKTLREMALDAGIDSKIISISTDYLKNSSNREALAFLEEQYCSSVPRAYSDSTSTELELIYAANYYAEAETAAAKITELIRDKNMRYRDILVICNDLDKRGSVIKRVFSEYGIPLFIDQRRGVHHNPALEYITALIDIKAYGWLPHLVFKFLKTDLTSISNAEIEELENYVIQFRISGRKWKQEFNLSGGEYTEEELLALNTVREQVVGLISDFEKRFIKTGNVREKTGELFTFLNEEALLPVKIEEYRQVLENDGYLEHSEEMSQVWKVILDIFDQFVDVLGEEILTDDEYSVILKTGFESIQMGMLPPSVDQIILGTMQRTRTGDIKALFVLGANDGVLPSYSGEETLLNEDERDVLYQKGNIICRNDEQIMNEEQMAIYRNFSKPLSYLAVSYSVSDTEGNEIRPSIIFEKIRRLFPHDPIRKDILNRDNNYFDLIQARRSTANHLTDAMRKWITDGLMPHVWKSVFNWFDANEPEITARIKDGLAFGNYREKIDEKFVTELYKPTYDESEEIIKSSPSGLENFSRCPFSFFMSRGIRLKERRIYELDSRNIGDVYHETLMKLGRYMCSDGRKPMDPDSKWNMTGDTEYKNLVSRIYDDIEESYNEGLLKDSKYEKYRSKRFKKIITDTALYIKRQVAAGRIESMSFESEFGHNGQFKPITVKRNGRTVEINGKIDRVDFLSNGYAKIIDYKSGSEELVKEDVIRGWQLQLMIYLKAVTDSNRDLKPAGVFYFRIPEPHIEAAGMTPEEIKDELANKMTGEYKMDGMVINDKSVIESITGELGSKSSNIIGAKLNRDVPEEATGKAVIEKDDFKAIESTVSSLITELCESMLSGDINAKPGESKKKKITACTYCSYKGICGHDRVFD